MRKLTLVISFSQRFRVEDSSGYKALLAHVIEAEQEIQRLRAQSRGEAA